MVRKAVALILTILAVAARGDAHPRLRSASPAPSAVLEAPPAEIRLVFNEDLVLQFTNVKLKDSKGRPIPTGGAALAPGDNAKLVVPIQIRLVPGRYDVLWSAVSVDTHRVSGSYSFKVSR